MMLNLLTPIFRLVDRALPFDALSLIAVLEPITAPREAAAPPAAPRATAPAARAARR
jgi:hypothetical protein